MATRPASRLKRLITAVIVVVALVITVMGYNGLMRERPATFFESDEDHFLYGSVGTETRASIPYWIWLVLPRIFPDLLPAPGGYASLGIVSKDGREMPIGLSKTTIGYPRVGMNCAFCHTATVRSGPDSLPVVVPGAPAHQTVAEDYRRFLYRAASDPRFSATTILAEVARNYRLSFFDRLLYRFVIIPTTRQQLEMLTDENAWLEDRPDWGHGRADLLSPLKFERLGRPVDKTIATADTTPLWGLGRREGRGLFWDGLHPSLRDTLVTSALAAGASRPWLDDDLAKWDETDARAASSLRRVQNYMNSLKPPPFPFAVDRALAATGEGVFKAECAQCHAADGPRTGTVVPASEVGTDPLRSSAWTRDAQTAYDAFAARRRWKASAFKPGNGYVAVPLDGVWLRAPYLHNGSVPSLSDLLAPQDQRPKRFWRGYDVYDQARVGFVSEGPEAEKTGTPHDTSQPGNGNGGHSYGTMLPADAKRALLEYLKTL